MNVDRNLVFGVLALQLGFVARDQLVEAFRIWASDKSRPLARVLRDTGALAEHDHALLEMVVSRHLENHDHDLEKSLAALSGIELPDDDWKGLADPELEQTLAWFSRARPQPLAATTPSRAAPAGGGRFRILRPYAEGGLGQVSLALDEDLHREVALKEIQPRYAHNPQSRRRFLLEAEITGRLEHPGIVPVYALGFHADGQPYYAMRFIQGDNLKDAIEHWHQAEGGRSRAARASELRRLLSRFIAAANAVAYAHSRGILHRDIKPANIMLGAYGETLLLDWGLARPAPEPDKPAGAGLPAPAVAGGPADIDDKRAFHPIEESTPTQTGDVLGTPPFMSPEQARGEIDRLAPASDVYSLGATLYTLLTGRLPFSASDRNSMLERIRRGDFPRPRAIDSRVPRPLEAICTKAMAREPADRYESATALAEDVERWLADDPVKAYAESPRERLARWLRRHRAWAQALTAALVLITIIAIAAAVLVNGARQREQVQASAATRSAKAAGAQRDLALSAFDKLTYEVQDELEDTPATRAVRERLLATALDGLRGITRISGPSAKADRTMFTAYSRMGDISLELRGATTKAKAHYERAFRMAKALANSRPGSFTAQRDLALAHRRLGSVSSDLGNKTAAREHFAEALAMAESLPLTKASRIETRQLVGVAASSLGDLHMTAGGIRAAREYYVKSLKCVEEAWRAQPASARARRELSVASSKLGSLSLEEGDAAAALKHFERSRKIDESLLASRPHSVEAKRDLSFTYDGLGDACRRLGEALAARQWYEKSLALRRELSDGDPSDYRLRRDLATATEKVGDMSLAAGDVAAGMLHYKNVHDIAQLLAQADPASADARRRLAVACEKQGDLKVRTGDKEGAMSDYKEAISIRRVLAKGDPADAQARRDLAVAYGKTGNLSFRLGEPGLARGYLERCLRELDAVAAADPESADAKHDLCIALIKLGGFHLDQREPEIARGYYQRSLKISKRLTDRYPSSAQFQRDLSYSYENLGHAAVRSGDAASARENYRQALDVRQAISATDPENVQAQLDMVAGLGNLGVAEEQLMDFAAAAGWYQKGVAILEKIQAQGKMENQPQYQEWLSSQRRKIATCGAAAKAIDDLSFALSHPPEEAMQLLLIRAAVLARRGSAAAVGETAEKLRALAPDQPNNLYNVACCYSQAIAAVEKGSPQAAGENEALRERYTTDAIAALRQAIALGYSDFEHLRQDKDLDPIRKQADYQRLLQDK